MMMAGPMHPPCRRKKLRPLRPRLTARTPLCSVPSSSPHKIFDFAGAPVFIPRIKRDCARRRVPEANRREAAALKPETNGPCTVQKRKTRGRGLRGRGRGSDCFSTQVSGPRRGAGRGFGGRCKALPSLLAAANPVLPSELRLPPSLLGGTLAGWGQAPQDSTASAAAERGENPFYKHQKLVPGKWPDQGGQAPQVSSPKKSVSLWRMFYR